MVRTQCQEQHAQSHHGTENAPTPPTNAHRLPNHLPSGAAIAIPSPRVGEENCSVRRVVGGIRSIASFWCATVRVGGVTQCVYLAQLKGNGVLLFGRRTLAFQKSSFKASERTFLLQDCLLVAGGSTLAFDELLLVCKVRLLVPGELVFPPGNCTLAVVNGIQSLGPPRKYIAMQATFSLMQSILPPDEVIPDSAASANLAARTRHFW
jgi:hypothetical protein